MTWANGFSGIVNIQVRAVGCNGPSSQVIRTVTIGQSVGTPTAITVSAGAEPTCQIANSTTTTTYSTTAANNTGFNWSLSNAAAGSISSTGVMTWANGFSGTVNIQVTANGCNGPSSQVIRPVTVGQSVGTPTAITGTPPSCQLTNGTTTTTFATTAANSTGFNWSISNSAAGSINATTGVMTWANGFSGLVDIQVTANGCNGPSSQVIRTVTINPPAGTPTAITVSSGTEPTCKLTNSTTTTTYATTATNSTGFNWSLSNSAAGSINSAGVMTWATGFAGTVKIQVTATGCNGASAMTVRSVTINPPFTPAISAAPNDSICLGQSVTLNASGYNSIDTVPGGTFDGGNPPGWSGASANNNNARSNSDWGETGGGKKYNGVTYNTNAPSGPKFMIVNGLTDNQTTRTAVLSSPVFGTVGMTSATLSWYQAFNFESGTSGKVELSLDGGTNYMTMLTYTQAAFGNPDGGFLKESFPLNDYLGQTNLKVRFTYVGTAGSNWAIDDVIIGGTKQPINYSWSSGQITQSITVSPTATTPYNLTSSTGNCTSTNSSIPITVNPLPTATISGDAAVCQNAASPNITFTGANGTAPYTFTYKIGNGANQTIKTTSGNSTSVTAPTTIAENFVYSLVSVQDGTSTACTQAQSGNATITVNPLPTVYTVIGGGNYCSGGTGVTIGLSGSQNGVNYQLMNGTTAVGTAVAGTGSAISFGSQTASGTYTVVATNSTTLCPQTMTGSVNVSINPSPTAYTVTGGGGYCAGGNGVAIGLSNSQTGVNYQLFNGATAVGTPKAGATGSAISFGLQTASGIYTIAAKNNSTLCTQNMTGGATVTVKPTPAPTISADGPTVSCSGAVKLTSDSATGNQWYKDGMAIPSATQQTYTAILAGSYTAIVTNTQGCSDTSNAIAVSFITSSWTAGALTSNWNDPINWCSGKVPTSSTDAIIPTGVTPYPKLTADGEVKSLTIQSGATVSLGGKTLAIYGALTGTGEFAGSAASGLTLNGTASPVTLYFDQTTDTTTNVLKNLTISPSVPVTVNLSNKLYITDTLAPGGSIVNATDTLTIRSTSILNTARVAEVLPGGEINGTVTVERFIPGRRSFRFISSPVTTTTSIKENWMENAVNSGVYSITNPKPGYGTNITGPGGKANGFDPTITNNPSLYIYKASVSFQKWDSVLSTGASLSAGDAYRLMVRGSRSTQMWDPTNNPPSSDTKLRTTGKLFTGTFPVNLSPNDNDFTFIGNPYASPVDFQSMIANNNKVQHIYTVWDPLLNTRGDMSIMMQTTISLFLLSRKLIKTYNPDRQCLYEIPVIIPP